MNPVPPTLPARARRVVADVAHLPTVTFGPSSISWWGTAGFAVIEGIVLFICVVSYFYLRRNFLAWPPRPTALPSLGTPTLGLALMLLSVIPMWYAARYAKRLAFEPMRIALVAAMACKIAVVVVRWYEFQALNTHWNSDAYGSIQWITVGFHASLLVMDLAEDIGLVLVLFLSKHVWERLYTDVADDAAYWYFTVAAWLPLFVMVYLLPRWI
jgi:heme/copper-type cytochrome/quinol oxidase subunit 3